MKSVQDRFWAQTIRNDPASFILYGDIFIYGTKREEEMELVLELWE